MINYLEYYLAVCYICKISYDQHGPTRTLSKNKAVAVI